MTITHAPGAEEIQWRNIRKVVRELADFCFGSATESGQITLGAAHTALTVSLTAKDGLSVQLEPLPVASLAAAPASEPVDEPDAYIWRNAGPWDICLAPMPEAYRAIATNIKPIWFADRPAAPAPVSGIQNALDPTVVATLVAHHFAGTRPKITDMDRWMAFVRDIESKVGPVAPVSGMPDLKKIFMASLTPGKWQECSEDAYHTFTEKNRRVVYVERLLNPTGATK